MLPLGLDSLHVRWARSSQRCRVDHDRRLAPLFGELRPSRITVAEYRAQIHAENEHIRKADQAGLAGPRVGELCQLDNQDVNLTKARFYVRDPKTDAGVRFVDIHPRLLDELTAYRASRPTAAMDAPAFPTRAGTRRDRNNVLNRVIHPVLARANELRSGQGEPPIVVHLTPHISAHIHLVGGRRRL